jgi:hypothetical protein
MTPRAAIETKRSMQASDPTNTPIRGAILRTRGGGTIRLRHAFRHDCRLLDEHATSDMEDCCNARKTPRCTISGNVGLGERRARGTSGSGNVGLGERRARGTSGSGNVRSDCLAMIDRYLPLRAGSQPGADRRDGHARRMPKVEAQGAHRGRWSAFTRTRLKAVDVSAASFAPFLIFGTANTTCEGTIFSQGCNTTVQS